MNWRVFNPFRCRHRSMWRERDPDGRALFVCACGYSQPQVVRTKAEQRKVSRVKTAASQLKAQRVNVSKVSRIERVK